MNIYFSDYENPNEIVSNLEYNYVPKLKAGENNLEEMLQSIFQARPDFGDIKSAIILIRNNWMHVGKIKVTDKDADRMIGVFAVRNQISIHECKVAIFLKKDFRIDTIMQDVENKVLAMLRLFGYRDIEIVKPSCENMEDLAN